MTQAYINRNKYICVYNYMNIEIIIISTEQTTKEKATHIKNCRKDIPFL